MHRQPDALPPSMVSHCNDFPNWNASSCSIFLPTASSGSEMPPQNSEPLNSAFSKQSTHPRSPLTAFSGTYSSSSQTCCYYQYIAHFHYLPLNPFVIYFLPIFISLMPIKTIDLFHLICTKLKVEYIIIFSDMFRVA